MTDALAVRANERGVVRVFGLDMPPEQVRFLREPGALGQLLGAGQVDPEYADIFPVSDLEDLGLASYLSEGCGIPDDQIAPDLGKLAAVDGHVLVLFSRALGGTKTILNPDPGLRLIAVYKADPVDWTGTPIQTDSARPTPTPASPRQTRAASRRIGGAVFAIFMAVIATLVILVVT